jgi:DNA-binding NarL/FixJ family response regulator
MKILIADDHPIVRRGLRQVLESDPSMVVIGEATNGDEALELARTLEWDLAVFDFSMPGRSGLDLLDSVKREFPTRPVLVMSMHSEELHGERVLKAGAAGYISKESAPQELASAVRKVARGGRYVSPTLAEALALELSNDSRKALHERLSDREYPCDVAPRHRQADQRDRARDAAQPEHREHLPSAHPEEAQARQQRGTGTLCDPAQAGRGYGPAQPASGQVAAM